MLHGSIKVNHQVIAKWSAQNLKKKDDRGFTQYRCSVIYSNQRGYTQKTGPFLMYHDADRGALILAAKVLETADRLFDIDNSR